MSMGLKYYLETYGCSLNTADSDIIVGRLEAIEGQRVKDISDAELILLNTCGVKEPTEDKIIHRLEELSQVSVPIVVTGCLPKISFKRVEKAIPGFAAILGPQSVETLASIVPRILEGERGILHTESDGAYKLKWFAGPPDSVICTIPICEGCLGSCAYCAVKFARGNRKCGGGKYCVFPAEFHADRTGPRSSRDRSVIGSTVRQGPPGPTCDAGILN